MSRWKRFLAFVSGDPPSPAVRVHGYLDRRGPREIGAARALEQERSDQEIERIWRDRVGRNVAERETGKRAARIVHLSMPRVVRGGGSHGN